MTNLERYCTSILDGKINACRRIKQVCERLLEDLYNPGQWHFDHDIAKHHVDFIERFCKVPSGRLGQPLKLELFQKARLEAIFGFVDDDGLRRYTEALILEGRKNGKTTESAAVELDLLVNDGEGAPQIYNVATKQDQAKLGYEAVKKMVRLSPLLNKHLRRRVSDIYNPKNMGFIKALSSNTNSLDGLDVHGAVIDELAAIKNRDLYDLIKQGTGARDQPLIFTITTNGFVRNGIFDDQYKYATAILDGVASNPRFLPFLYQLDSPDEWDKEECWIKANPGLGTIKRIETLREWVQKAKDDPSFKATVMVKDFGLPQTSTAAWLLYEELNNEAVWTADEAIKFDYCIGGFDAADTTDLNAAKAICMRPDDPHIYVRSMYWIPQAVLDKQAEKGTRQERDNVPYTLWVEQGLMRTCPGNKCDKRVFLEWFTTPGKLISVTVTNMSTGKSYTIFELGNQNRISIQSGENLSNTGLLDYIYPVGSIYMSTNSTNPGMVFGGSWVPWGTGRVPVGVDTGDSSFNTVEKTGGEKTHKLTTNEMPSHGHKTNITLGNRTQSGSGIWAAAPGEVDSTWVGQARGVGGSAAHNNLQPYITCYMWKRTA